MFKKSKNILLSLSGGVDSSTSLYKLLTNFNVETLTFSVFDPKEENFKILQEKIKRIANYFNVKNYFIDLHDTFYREIICNFIDGYMLGTTPNPCVLCNKNIKFKILYEKALELGFDNIATGHYAKVEFKNDRYFIKKHQDKNKDQSYMLWMLPQEYLSKIIFPLSDVISKNETREIATKHKFINVVDTIESQDICFLQGSDYKDFLKEKQKEKMINLNGGDIIFENKIIGKHKGYPFYTIGQRGGLNVALGYPVFVKEINAAKNQIIVCKEEDLYSKEMIVTNLNFQKYEKIKDGFKCVAKVRYRDIGHKCTLFFIDDKKIKVVFEEKVKAITKGQSAVFFEENDIIGGGIIS